MSNFRLALDRLAALNVSGVQGNHAITAVPETLERGQLPALLVLPIQSDDDNALFAERGGGFESLAFSAGGQSVRYTVDHLLLVAPAAAGSGIRSHLPALIDLIDAYFSALGGTVTLDGALLEPSRVRVEPGIHTHGEIEYVGCTFRHTWILEV